MSGRFSLSKTPRKDIGFHYILSAYQQVDISCIHKMLFFALLAVVVVQNWKHVSFASFVFSSSKDNIKRQLFSIE